MLDIPDKRRVAATFRERLAGALTASNLSRAALARAIGVDRSSITQMLAGGETRMPGGHVVAACAQALDVSADWLLGLTDRPEQAGALLASSFSISETGRATGLDDQIFAWHREAEGYKVRKIDMEDGMIEAYVLKDGQRLELYLDAALNVVRSKIDD